MFTPPPSPLPRDFGPGASSTRSDSSPTLSSPAKSLHSSGSLLSPRTTPLTSASNVPSTPTHDFRQAMSKSQPVIALAQPPSGKNGVSFSTSSSRASKSHARNSTIAVLHGDKAALSRAVAASAASANAKKSHGRNLRLVAFAVPLLLVAITIFAQSWRTSAVAKVLAPNVHQVWRRADGDDGLSTSGTSTGTSTDSATSTPTTTVTRVGDIPVAPADDAIVTLPTPFPQPFDSSLGKNFTTQTCSSFFNTFTSSKGFRSCRGFGMLLANSNAWFVAAQQATPAANKDGGIDYLNQLVWGTCHTVSSRDECVDTMKGLEGQIRTACKDELKTRNAIAVAALVGFSNWAQYRDLGCIINPRSNAYCYVESLNAADANDAYLYSLPLGIDMKTPRPTCSRCAQQVMGTLRQYAGNATLPIAKTYPEIQSATSTACGADYALPATITAGSSRTLAMPLLSLFAATLSVALLL
ncbi:hypothetical protein BKA62DRAFT_685862 [Auriculariales sp. MPI-PUGE-AT-0066]|nr:hypothetical protein BKA62DRAFT_685862 [Auriculariales sp. MPI-PUGE-AT-0066]